MEKPRPKWGGVCEVRLLIVTISTASTDKPPPEWGGVCELALSNLINRPEKPPPKRVCLRVAVTSRGLF